jgi:hypothetical protein
MKSAISLLGLSMVLGVLLAFMLLFPCNFAFGQTESAISNDKIPVFTVCEVLQNLSAYNNKSIIVIGQFAHTDEGGWIVEDCENKIVTEGYTWGNSISILYIVGQTEPPPSLPANFHWDDELLLKKAMASKNYDKSHDLDEWGAWFGRLETRIPPRVIKYPNGTIGGLGFGHLGTSIAQLISRGSECVRAIPAKLK